MYLKVVLIYLVSLIGSCCVRGYEEFNCQYYALKQNEQFLPAQFVRVCGAAEYENIPKIFRALLGIEKPVQHLLPPLEKATSFPYYANGFSQNVVADNGAADHLHKFYESKQQYLPAVHPIPYYHYETSDQSTEGELIDDRADDLIDFRAIDKPQQQEEKKLNLDSIVNDVAAIKHSVDELKNNLKDISHYMLAEQKTEDKSETNINIVFKLGPTLELLAKTILQSTEDSAEGKKAIEHRSTEAKSDGLGAVEENKLKDKKLDDLLDVIFANQSEENGETVGKSEESVELQSTEEKSESEETSVEKELSELLDESEELLSIEGSVGLKSTEEELFKAWSLNFDADMIR